MPDFIKQCDVCEEFVHRDTVVDGTCQDCRDMVRQQGTIDPEYNHYLTMFLKGEAPSIAPNGQFREIWTGKGRHRIQFPREWTQLDRRQRIPKK